MEDKNTILIDLYKLNKKMEDVISKACLKMRLNYVEFMMLGLAKEKDMNVSKLSSELGISKSAVSQAIVCLSIKRLITKEPAVDNKKSFYIRLTKKAIKVLDELCLVYQPFLENVKSEMGKEKYQMFLDLAKQINENIHNIEGGSKESC